MLNANDSAIVIAAYKTLLDKYNEIGQAVAAGKATGEIKTTIDKANADLVAMQDKYKALADRTDAAEAKEADLLKRIQALSEGPPPAKTLGQLVIEDAGLKTAIAAGSRMSFSMVVKGKFWELVQRKDIVGLSQTIPILQPGIAVGPRLPFGVRTLEPQGRTTAGAVEYVHEVSFTNNAAPVAEGAAKPKSDKVFDVQSAIVRTIAHYFKVSRQTFEDLPAVAAQIESNGIYGVQLAEDDQLLNGTNVAPQLKGFMPVATAAPAPAAPGTGMQPNTILDAIGAAYFDLAGKGYVPDGVVVNPADWGKVSLMRNTQGNYLFANPIDGTPIQRVWGMRMVQSAKMAAGNFLVGAFQGNSLLLDREDVTVQIATQNEDDFIKNMITILIEERLVNLIFQSTAFEKGVVPAVP